MENIKKSSINFGLEIPNASTSLDFKEIAIKDERVCLHDEKIPFRLKGKGSKRLLSIAIQAALLELGGIVLVDELEQGLEPDRIKHLVRTLYCNNNGQFFMSTHSQAVIEELECENLLRLNNENGNLSGEFVPDDSYQSLIRLCPEPIFALLALLKKS